MISIDIFTYYSFIIFIIEPMVEWGIHIFLHKINNYSHNMHHKHYNEKIVTPEVWPIISACIAFYYNYYYIAYGFLKYWCVHTLIHFYPKIFPKLTRHHYTHHKYKNYNFSVSAIWPDYIFGTLYIYKKKNKI